MSKMNSRYIAYLGCFSPDLVKRKRLEQPIDTYHYKKKPRERQVGRVGSLSPVDADKIYFATVFLYVYFRASHTMFIQVKIYRQ